MIHKVPLFGKTFFTLQFYAPIVLFSRHAGLDVKQYRYYDKATCGLDISGMLEDLNVSSVFCTYLLCFCGSTHSLYKTVLAA